MKTIALIVSLAAVFGIAVPEIIDNVIPLHRYLFVMIGIFAAGFGSILGFVLGTDEATGPDPDLGGALLFVALAAFWVSAAITYSIFYLLTN